MNAYLAQMLEHSRRYFGVHDTGGGARETAPFWETPRRRTRRWTELPEQPPLACGQTVGQSIGQAEAVMPA